MSNVASLILSYGTTDFLKPCIRQYKWLDKILVMNYLFPESDPFPDNTPEICMSEGVECKTGSGLEQGAVYNLGLDDLKDYDVVFIVDNDEFIMKADQERLIKEMAGGKYGKGFCPIIDYYQNLYHKYIQRGHHPIVIASPDTRFYSVRNSMGGGHYFKDIYLHHLGFLFSPEKMEWKRKKQLKTNITGFDEAVWRKIEHYEPPEELVRRLEDA